MTPHILTLPLFAAMAALPAVLMPDAFLKPTGIAMVGGIIVIAYFSTVLLPSLPERKRRQG
ncbi:MAG: hypothetical protein JXR76_08510 [Deltaproteobacteria bacterium]|nr:hypothetical protein [Deltaproteobacteria bacterium]